MFKDGMSTLSRAAGRGRHFQGQRAESSDRPRRNAFPAQNGHFARDVHAFRPHSGRPPRSRKICSVQGPAQGQPPKPIGASKHQRDKTDKAVNNSPSKNPRAGRHERAPAARARPPASRRPLAQSPSHAFRGPGSTRRGRRKPNLPTAPGSALLVCSSAHIGCTRKTLLLYVGRGMNN